MYLSLQVTVGYVIITVTRSGHNQYFCAMCGHTSAHKHNVIQHIRSKHLGTKFNSPHCSFITPWHISLDRHMKLVHKELIH